MREFMDQSPHSDHVSQAQQPNQVDPCSTPNTETPEKTQDSGILSAPSKIERLQFKEIERIESLQLQEQTKAEKLQRNATIMQAAATFGQLIATVFIALMTYKQTQIFDAQRVMSNTQTQILEVQSRREALEKRAWVLPEIRSFSLRKNLPPLIDLELVNHGQTRAIAFEGACAGIWKNVA